MRNFWRNNSADEDKQIMAEELSDGRLTTLPALEVRFVTSGSFSYVGSAVPGSDPAVAVWQIFRLDESAGLHKAFADGSSSFDKVWSDRESYVY